MSIGIAVTLPDGVVLVADGKQTLILVDNQQLQVEDEAEKISKVRASVFAINFGVRQASDLALRNLKNKVSPKDPPKLWANHLESSVRHGWDSFIETCSPKFNRHHPVMRAALILGGIAQAKPFIAGHLCDSTGGMDSPELRTRSQGSFIGLGGEEQQVQTSFNQKASKVVNSIGWQPNMGPENELTRSLVQVAEDIIRKVEKENPRVGGVIKYMIVRKNFPNSRGKREKL